MEIKDTEFTALKKDVDQLKETLRQQSEKLDGIQQLLKGNEREKRYFEIVREQRSRR